MLVNKKKLLGLVEPFIYEKLSRGNYEVISVEPSQLLTWNRFDLGFKLFYLDNFLFCPEQARRVYKEDIRSQTMGKFSEFGNDDKTGIEKYVKDFSAIYESMKLNGFDDSQTVIPLSSADSIINGAHRVASAIHLNKKVICVQTENNLMTCDYRYFYERNVPESILDISAVKFIEYAEKVYLAFLWPSGWKNIEEAKNLFKNVVYTKKITLTPRGAFNLIVELYKHMEWVGQSEAGYPGVKQKLLECFPNFDEVTVIAFQSESIIQVREIKEKIRRINNIGFSSVHITDEKEEAIRISRLVFNANGLHFLNFANLNRFPLHSTLEKFRGSLQEAGATPEDVVIDGSVILSLYGIRKNADIDFITDGVYYIKGGFENHQSELKYHSVGKEELVRNPECHFYYGGFKFVSFNHLYEMKKRRGEKKDKNDLALMKSFMGGSKIQEKLCRSRQMIFYFRLKVNSRSRVLFYQFLKAVRLYEPIRSVYRRLRGRTK